MKVEQTGFSGVLKIKHPVYEDERGYFQELYHRDRALQNELNVNFVQDNVSKSRQGVLRGLHYQLHNPQGKLMQPVTGTIYDVAVDIREGSPTFGEWEAVILEEGTGEQLFVPEGFAHGFCVLSEDAHVMYKCTAVYDPEDDRGIRWNDPDLAVDWPVDSPILSEKDSNLSDLTEAELPTFEGDR